MGRARQDWVHEQGETGRPLHLTFEGKTFDGVHLRVRN